MSYLSGRYVASVLLQSIGIYLAAFGLLKVYIVPSEIPPTPLFGNIALLIGTVMVFIGIAYYPSGKRELKQIKSIVEIVTVRKQVSISDISEETGLDPEYIQKVITKRLISGSLSGYLEDDLFVCDSVARGLNTVDDID
jgi:hypothetical protein